MTDPDSADQTRPRVPPAATAAVRVGHAFLAPAQSPDELGRFAGYRVLRLLGAGGMGLVYAAEEVSLRRPVALKVLKPELAADPESRERFLREARAAAEITSDYVVTVLHVGESGGLPFLVMPLLVGETLQARIERPDPLDVRTALVIARDIAAGLAAAHAKGLIHRDVKPANIWLEEIDVVECNVQTGTCGDSSDALGRPPRCHVRAVLLDFGLARKPLHETSLTSTGFIVGTPNYMSPEQAAGTEVDARADLFALGCVAYVMLTGELPFQGTGAMAVMMALATKDPAPVRAKNPAVPKAASDLVARLLAKRPADRVQTAADAVCDLEAAIATLSASAPATVLRLPAAPVNADTLVPAGATHPVPPVPPAAKRTTAVGVLYSQTGPLALGENPILDATLLAIEEVNAAGGVLGRRVKAVVADGRSDPDEFARRAGRLLAGGRCAAVFGCGSSPFRKAVRPVVERANGLLFYPAACEGLEESPRVVYLGPAPNQHLTPAADFALDELGARRLALIGSDDVYSRVAHAIIADHVKARGGGEVVLADAFLASGAAGAVAAARVRLAGADAVINTGGGAASAALFRSLRASLSSVPVVSVRVSADEARGLARTGAEYLVGSSFEAGAFEQKVRAKYGADRVATDAMAAAYCGVHLWARAVAAAGTADPSAVLARLGEVELDGPLGLVAVDPASRYARLPVRVGQVRPDGSAAVVKELDPQPPVPFPGTRTRERWAAFLRGLELDWGGKWQAPD